MGILKLIGISLIAPILVGTFQIWLFHHDIFEKGILNINWNIIFKILIPLILLMVLFILYPYFKKEYKKRLPGRIFKNIWRNTWNPDDPNGCEYFKILDGYKYYEVKWDKNKNKYVLDHRRFDLIDLTFDKNINGIEFTKKWYNSSNPSRKNILRKENKNCYKGIEINADTFESFNTQVVYTSLFAVPKP